MSDPTENPVLVLQPPPLPDPSIIPPPHITQTSPKAVPVKADPSFARKHGPINKVIEAVLDKLPDPLIELLSQDLSLNIRNWNPAEGLLHKLNPTGLPPHRLRIKVGCVVTLLKHLEVNSQLSKNQHLRILRYENDYLECLVLDGQLEGTKMVLTRVPFVAKYKGLDQHSYQRTQFPIRVATGYTQPSAPRDASKTGVKLPSTPDRLLSEGLPRIVAPHDAKAKPSANLNLGFKLPGPPASKSSSLEVDKYISITKPAADKLKLSPDCWDDFLDSSTQISRDLAAEGAPKVSTSMKAPLVPLAVADCLPPLSTQDLDFSMDELDEEPSIPKAAEAVASRAVQEMLAKVPTILSTKTPTRPMAAPNSGRRLAYPKKIAGRCLNPGPLSRATQIEYELSKLRPSQLPKGMTEEWRKRKATTPSPTSPPPAKRQCVQDACATVTKKSVASLSPEGMSEDFTASIEDQFFDEEDFDFRCSI
ncbi:atp-dependent dna helicase pif1 [Pyrenophora seminiperda CCB06]|uniref:Atp-dependent dna helicase pif1 n=1 Tax=Pyrenophora seminiperda CCB06 TaxID=1302712 RepID=A0A3M7MEX0_9PLEO|nr:atp-dependent dna helicase pif1 [Pyrenophora seminiperda CCB06]